MEKWCRKCSSSKVLTEFHLRKTSPDGLREVCKECARKERRDWARNNPEKHAKSCRAPNKKWRLENPDKHVLSIRTWQRKNAPVVASYVSGRRAKKILATPGWTNQIVVDEFYAFAAIKSQMTGARWEVDHVVPLKSEIVCGLHTHFNLQVLIKQENIRKGNRVWPDMP